MPATARRDLRILVAAALVSSLGDAVAFIALWTQVHDRAGSGPAVAALFIALWGPLVLFAAPAGRLADRVENRRLLIAASLVQAAVAVALAFTTALGPLLALVACLGAATAVAQPADFALVPHAVGEEHVQAANSRLEMARALGFVAGPLLGGAAAAAGATRYALLADAASFAAVAVAATALIARRAPHPHAAKPRLREGVEPLLADRALATVLAGAVVSLVFVSISTVAEVFFAIDVLHMGDTGFALLITCWTLGMLAGAAGVARRVPPHALAGAALAAVAIQGAGFVIAAGLATIGTALAGYLIGGVAHGAKNALVRTLMHKRVPDAARGRAFAAWNAARNAAELGALAAGGAIIGGLGARGALLLAGIGPLLVAAAAFAALRAARLASTPILANR